MSEGILLLWIQEHLRGGLDGLFIPFTHLGDHGMLFIVLTAVLILIPRTRRAGTVAAGALILSLLGTNLLLKPLVERPRPWLDVAGLIPLVVENDPASFPSGHTSAAFAFASAMVAALPWTWGKVAAVLVAVLMGFSRLYVGVHYPTDVLCGALLGVLYGWCAWKLVQQRETR